MEDSSVSHTLTRPLLLEIVVSARRVNSNVFPSITAHLRRRACDRRPTGHHPHAFRLIPTQKDEGDTVRQKPPLSLVATAPLLLKVVVSLRNVHSSMSFSISAHLWRRACDRRATGHRLRPSCPIPIQKAEGGTARRKQPAVLVSTSFLPLLPEAPECFRSLKGVESSLDYLVLLLAGSGPDTRTECCAVIKTRATRVSKVLQANESRGRTNLYEVLPMEFEYECRSTLDPPMTSLPLPPLNRRAWRGTYPPG